jgi:hypothetical protein
MKLLILQLLKTRRHNVVSRPSGSLLERGSAQRGSARVIVLCVGGLVLAGVGLALLLRSGGSAAMRVEPPTPADTHAAPTALGDEGNSAGARAPELEREPDLPRAMAQIPSTEDGAAIAKPLSKIEWKRKWLTGCLADLRAVDPKNAEQQVEHAIVTSIVVLLDAAGTSTPHPPGEMDLRVPAGYQILLHNESVYKFRIGDFPEYDELLEFRARRAQWAGIRPRDDADPIALEEWSRSEPQFPPGLVQRAIDRAEESLALVQ